MIAVKIFIADKIFVNSRTELQNSRLLADSCLFTFFRYEKSGLPLQSPDSKPCTSSSFFIEPISLSESTTSTSTTPSISHSPAQNLNPIPDLRGLNQNNVPKAATAISIQKLQTFLIEYCPALITDASFITGKRPFLDSYFEFKKANSEYMSTKTRIKKTNLSLTIEKIDGMVKDIVRKIEDASHIKLDPKLGTQVICQNSANKLALLAEIIALSNKLRNFITSCVMTKMKKRMTQASKSLGDNQLTS